MSAPSRKSSKVSAVRTKVRGEDGRPLDDDYPTPPECTRLICHWESPQQDGPVWDPFAGAGVLLNVARDEGVDMVGTSLVDYGHPDIEYGVDFRRLTAPRGRKIVTNPPFGLIDETDGKIVGQMLDMVDFVALFVPNSFLQAGGRYRNVFKDRPPKRIYQLVDRVTLIPHRLWLGRQDPEWEQGATPYCWFVWERGEDNHDHGHSELRFVESRPYQREFDLEKYQVSRPGLTARLHPRML